MGSPEEEPQRLDNEAIHQVRLTRALFVKRTEVTQGEWRAVMGNDPSYSQDCGDDCPVEDVSWMDAAGYANARSRAEGLEECYRGADSLEFVGLGCMGYRLPTEAEWEYAYRAGMETAYYWRAEPIENYAWYNINSGDRTQPVGTKLSNAWGLSDMAGNVWEWTNDWYARDYGGFNAEGVTENPLGGPAALVRVVRGGSWDATPQILRAAFRYWHHPSERYHRLGFRPVKFAP